MLNNKELDLQPQSKNIQIMMTQVSSVRNNYYEGMDLGQCPDDDVPRNKIMTA